MKNLLLSLFVAFGSAAYAQAPFIQWQKSLGGSSLETAQCISRTADSGYIVVSTTGSANGQVGMNKGGYDCWIVKLTSWGDIEWKKVLGGTGSDYPNSVMQTADGGYIVGCKSQSNDGDLTGNHGDFDVWIAKLDDTGRIQWQKNYGGSAADRLNAIQQTSDGGYIFTGTSESSDGDVSVNHGNEDVWVVKINSSGTIEWEKTYGGTDEEDGVAIRQTTDGGFILAATTRSSDGDVAGNHGGDDVWILKLTATGSVTWSRCYGGSGTEQNGDHAYPGNIEITSDGGYAFTGFTNSTDGDVTGYHGGSFFDYWVVKISSTGALQWQKTLGGTDDDDGYFLQQTSDDGYIVCGTSNSSDGDVTTNIGSFDYWIIKLTSAGAVEWQKNYGGSLDEYPYCIRATSDSEFIICGYTKSNNGDVSGNHGDYDSWVVKLAYCSLPVVNPVNGPSAVCVGAVIALSDNTAGGTWSAGNGNITVAGPSVTGVYPGNATVFYTKTTSCGTGGATHTVAVNAAPLPVISASGSTLSTATTFVSYQWIKDGTPIAGATSATYTVTAHGTYSVTVTNENGCSATAAGYVYGLAVSGINTAASIIIAPNPATNYVYISGADDIVVKVYDLLGQQATQTTERGIISLSGLPGGIYLLRVFDRQGRLLAQEKVLKE